MIVLMVYQSLSFSKYEDSIELLTTAEILQLSQEGRLYSQKDFEKIEAILKDQGIDPDQLMSQSIVLTPSLPPSQPTDQPGRQDIDFLTLEF